MKTVLQNHSEAIHASNGTKITSNVLHSKGCSSWKARPLSLHAHVAALFQTRPRRLRIVDIHARN